MLCVLRSGFSLIFERGLGKDICLHRITQKSTWSGLGRDDRHYLLYHTDETVFEPNKRQKNVGQCWDYRVFNLQTAKSQSARESAQQGLVTNVMAFNRIRTK